MSSERWVGEWITAEEHQELIEALRALRKRMPEHKAFIDAQIGLLESDNQEKEPKRGMKVSIDGLRKNLMIAYNEAVHGYRNINQPDGLKYLGMDQLKTGIDDLRTLIGGFLCMFSDNTDDLCSDMSEHCDKLLFADPEDADEDEEGK